MSVSFGGESGPNDASSWRFLTRLTGRRTVRQVRFIVASFQRIFSNEDSKGAPDGISTPDSGISVQQSRLSQKLLPPNISMRRLDFI